MGEAPSFAHEEATAFARPRDRGCRRPAGGGRRIGAARAPMAALARAVMDLGAAGAMIAPPGALGGGPRHRRLFPAPAPRPIGADVPFVLAASPQADGVPAGRGDLVR